MKIKFLPVVASLLLAFDFQTTVCVVNQTPRQAEVKIDPKIFDVPGLQFMILIAAVVIGFAAIILVRRRYMAPLIRRIREERGDHSLKVIDDTEELTLRMLEATPPGQQNRITKSDE